MRAILTIGAAALALSACGSSNTANNDANAMLVNDMMMDQNAAATGGMDANVATNAAPENMIVNDLTHNDTDTNLSNGL